jgi:hypothetical protein
MSKLKKTPITKMIEILVENTNHFEEKQFLGFLIEQALKLQKKERKIIEKSFLNGIESGIEFYLEEKKGSIPNFKTKINEVKEFDIPSAYFKETFTSKPKFKNNCVCEDCDSKISEFCISLSENPISINEESETPAKEQIEELLMKRLQEVGIEPKSVKIVKL